MSVTELRKDSLPKRVIELEQELVKDLALNEVILKEKSLSVPGIRSKWNLCYNAEKSYLNKLEKLKDKLIEEYTKNHGEIGKPKFITDREAAATEQLQKLNDGINTQKEVIRFLDGVMEIMRNFGYDVKNCVDLVKLESH